MNKTQELIQNKVDEKHIFPAVDTYETADEYVLKADMPGVHKDNLEIIIEEDTLTIKGKVENLAERVTYSEYKPYPYLRSFKLGNDINREKIKAVIDQGVLTLTLPKAEKVKPRKIEIFSE